MNKILKILIALCIFCTLPAFCEEVNPEQTANDNRAVVTVQKQPATESTHKQGIHQNKWCIIIQVNGKVKENATKLSE